MEQFEYPKKAVWEEETYRPNYGQLTVEPLEKGYAVTIGNSLRRVLLSSIPGAAITSIRIEGAAHEFSSLPGVREDITDLVLNLKQVKLKSNITELPKTFTVVIKEKNEVLAADLFPGPEITVLNPNLHLATLSEGAELKMDVVVAGGFGYVPVSRMNGEGLPIGYIPLAAAFSPITRVSYRIENTRVGQRVDYERLIIQIWTTGAVTPREAVVYATDILQKHFGLIAGKNLSSEEETVGAETPLNQFLSTRVANILKGGGINTVKDLLRCSEQELSEISGLGEKALTEIKEFLNTIKKTGYTNSHSKLEF